MSKKNAENQVAAIKAKKERKESRAFMEPLQKVLNTKSPKCRQCVGSILNQNEETRQEILETIKELKL